MNSHHRISRRTLLRTSMVAGVGLVVPAAAFGALCGNTPAQADGPFYMNRWDRTKSVSHFNDLTWVENPNKKAEGEIIYVNGQVTDSDCRPVKGAIVEIWQACRTGRYAHIADPNSAWLDPNFRYFGEYITGDDGKYSFKTIKPGPYPVGPDWTRPAHVHFKISAGLEARMLTTQMYFADDPFLGADHLLSSLSNAERKRLIIEPARRTGGNTEDLYNFDVHVARF